MCKCNPTWIPDATYGGYWAHSPSCESSSSSNGNDSKDDSRCNCTPTWCQDSTYGGQYVHGPQCNVNKFR